MIANAVEERFAADELARAKQRMTVAERLLLLDERQFALEISNRVSICVLVARTDHQANIFNAGAEGFLDDNSQRGLLRAIAIDQRLQRERVLISSSRGNDRPFCIHLVLWEVPPVAEVGKIRRGGQPASPRPQLSGFQGPQSKPLKSRYRVNRNR